MAFGPPVLRGVLRGPYRLGGHSHGHTVSERHRVIASIIYPIPVPEKVFLLFLSSILLAAGATLFRFLGPQRVQEVSETQWVEINNHARLEYLSESHTKRRGWVIATSLFTWAGGGIGIWLIADRIVATCIYLLRG